MIDVPGRAAAGTGFLNDNVAGALAYFTFIPALPRTMHSSATTSCAFTFNPYIC
jgi:hypothetical protein